MRTISTMLWLWPAAGCAVGVPPTGTPTGQVLLSFSVTPTERLSLSELQLSLSELVLDAEGPSGAESVSVLLDRRLDPLGEEDPVRVELELGAHDDLSLVVHLASSDGPGLLATGSVVADEPRPVCVAIDTLHIPFHQPSLHIGDTPILGRIVLDLEPWATALLEDEGDEETPTEETSTEETSTEETSTEETSTEETPTEETPTEETSTEETTGDTGALETTEETTGDTGALETTTEEASGRDVDASYADACEDDDDLLVVTPGSGERYDRLVEAIVDSAWWVLEPIDDDQDDDDQDDDDQDDDDQSGDQQ